ncbi:unnamed protein product [Gordionus sp. m RMFG-2023]
MVFSYDDDVADAPVFRRKFHAFQYPYYLKNLLENLKMRGSQNNTLNITDEYRELLEKYHLQHQTDSKLQDRLNYIKFLHKLMTYHLLGYGSLLSPPYNPVIKNDTDNEMLRIVLHRLIPNNSLSNVTNVNITEVSSKLTMHKFIKDMVHKYSLPNYKMRVPLENDYKPFLWQRPNTDTLDQSRMNDDINTIKKDGTRGLSSHSPRNVSEIEFRDYILPTIPLSQNIAENDFTFDHVNHLHLRMNLSTTKQMSNQSTLILEVASQASNMKERISDIQSPFVIKKVEFFKPIIGLYYNNPPGKYFPRSEYNTSRWKNSFSSLESKYDVSEIKYSDVKIHYNSTTEDNRLKVHFLVLDYLKHSE